MKKYNELVMDDQRKVMQLYKGLSEEEDKVLTQEVTRLIKEGKSIRMQVVADEVTEEKYYVEGYHFVKNLLSSL